MSDCGAPVEERRFAPVSRSRPTASSARCSSTATSATPADELCPTYTWKNSPQEESMLVLISVHVVVAMIVVHRFLQHHAPTNHVVRHARASAPTMRAAALHAGLAAACLTGLRAVGLAIAAGAPRVLYLLVLVMAWDAIKLLGSATWLLGRAAAQVLRQRAPRIRSRRRRVSGRESRARRVGLEPSVARPH